jgi:hypothetical protein
MVCYTYTLQSNFGRQSRNCIFSGTRISPLVLLFRLNSRSLTNKSSCLLIFHFGNRIIPIWNSLPSYVMNANSIGLFEKSLDRFWSNQACFFITKPTWPEPGVEFKRKWRYIFIFSKQFDFLWCEYRGCSLFSLFIVSFRFVNRKHLL